MIHLDSLATFTRAYPDEIASFSHDGDKEPLFEVPRLAILAGNLPRSHTQIVASSDETPNDTSIPPALIIQGAPGLKNDIRLLAVQRDSDFDRMIEQIIRPLGPLTRAAGIPIEEVESAVALTSPDIVGQSEIAEEPLLILQCRGERSLILEEENSGPERAEQPMPLPAGMAVFLPYGTTYRLENSSTTSVSLEIKLFDRGAPKPTLLERLTSYLPKLGRR